MREPVVYSIRPLDVAGKPSVAQANEICSWPVLDAETAKHEGVPDDIFAALLLDRDVVGVVLVDDFVVRSIWQPPSTGGK
jgi:hypothetical protein